MKIASCPSLATVAPHPLSLDLQFPSKFEACKRLTFSCTAPVHPYSFVTGKYTCWKTIRRLGRSLCTPEFVRAGTGFPKFWSLIHELSRNPVPVCFSARSEVRAGKTGQNPVPAQAGIEKPKSCSCSNEFRCT
jgi:hypothetical protein